MDHKAVLESHKPPLLQVLLNIKTFAIHKHSMLLNFSANESM